MTLRVPKSAIAIGVALLVAIIAMVAMVPWLVSTDLVRSAIEREINTFSGRPVSIGGDVSVRLFPIPTAVFDDVTFQARGNEKRSILTVENVEADIAPLTLLSRDPSFTAIRLKRPHLRLIKRADGTVNWRDSMGRIGAAVDMARERVASDGAEKPLLIDEFPKEMASVGITDGTLAFEDLALGTEEQITGITGSINWLQLDGAASITGTGSWRDTPFSVSFNANAPLALFAGSSTNSSIAFESDAASLNFDGSLNFYEKFFVEGDLEFNTQSASDLLKLFGAKIDAGRAIGPLSISGPLALFSKRARFEQAQLSIEDNAGSGALEVSFPDIGPWVVAGTLEFESLDLSSLLGSFVTVPQYSWQYEIPISLDFLSQLHTDLRLSAQTANFRNIELSELAATAQISDKSAIFDIGDAMAYGGNVQARLQFNRGKYDDDKSLMSISGQGVDLGLIDEALDLPSTVPLGIAQMSIDVEAPLGSWTSMSRAATGRVMLKMNEGATRGFGIETLLSNAELSQFFTLSDSQNGQETFDALSIEGALTDGIATLETAQIVYPNGRVRLEGVAPYRSGGIALTATVEPIAETEAGTYQFFIGGSWDRAFATPLIATPPLGE